MHRHLHARRWRASLAMRNVPAFASDKAEEDVRLADESRIDFDERWESLGTYISAVQSADMAFKREALHRFSSFLLIVAPSPESFFKCPDAFTISISSGTKDISLRVQDIQVLHNLLFSELTTSVSLLFWPKSEGKEHKPILFSRPCEYEFEKLAVLVEVLRCCIRMLPLLEYNTGLSLGAAETLAVILKRLCCPSNVYLLGLSHSIGQQRNQLTEALVGSIEVKENRYFASRLEKHNLAAPWNLSMDLCMKHLQECLSSYKRTEFSVLNHTRSSDMGSKSQKEQMHVNTSQVACSLLEVFMDELLLQPSLADTFWNCEGDDVWSFSGLSCGRSMKLSFEAAVAHFLISVSSYSCFEFLHDLSDIRSWPNTGSGLSLPAAVLLFDYSVINALHLPCTFLVHIMQFLCRLLDIGTNSTSELPGAMLLSLAASVLETSTNLYFRHWALDPFPMNWEETECCGFLDSIFTTFVAKFGGMLERGNTNTDSELLEMLFSKKNDTLTEWFLLQNSLLTNFKMDAVHAVDANVNTPHRYCKALRIYKAGGCGTTVCIPQGQEHMMQAYGNCSDSSKYVSTLSNTALLVSTLQLISTSLTRLVAEAEKEAITLKTQHASWESDPCTNAALYIDHAKEAFKFCSSKERETLISNVNLHPLLEKRVRRPDDGMCHALTFFMERLYVGFEQGAPKALRKAYWDVLNSLVTLLNFSDQRRNAVDPSPSGLPDQAFQIGLNSVRIIQSVEQGTKEVEPLSNEVNVNQPISSIPQSIKQDPKEVEPPSNETNVIKSTLVELASNENDVQKPISSTVLLTKNYQHKRNKIISSKRDVERPKKLSNGICSETLPVATGSEEDKGVTPRSCLKDGDPYIQEVLTNAGKIDGDCFDDLKDFIVCKDGRDYSIWMESRHKKREKKHRRSFWKRLRAKRALVALLSSKVPSNEVL